METNTVLNLRPYEVRKYREDGFTLLELMIAVSLIAILATIAYPSFYTTMAKGDRASGIAQINSIAQSLERYYTFNRGYTNDFGDLSLADNDTYSVVDTENLYTYHIIIPNPAAPKVENVITTDTNGQSYILYAQPDPRNKDIWILSQDELSIQRHFSLDDHNTPIDGWP